MSAINETSRPDLKRTLMELGNRLVTERHFLPASSTHEGTGPIRQFTEWLNATPDAQEVLREMGIDWPM